MHSFRGNADPDINKQLSRVALPNESGCAECNLKHHNQQIHRIKKTGCENHFFLMNAKYVTMGVFVFANY